MTTRTAESVWYVFAKLPSDEDLVPGETDGCLGADAWGACPALAAGKTPACAGAAWFYGPEPSWRIHNVTVSAMCPFVLFDPTGPLPIPQD
jgi:hypothetical protein